MNEFKEYKEKCELIKQLLQGLVCVHKQAKTEDEFKLLNIRNSFIVHCENQLIRNALIKAFPLNSTISYGTLFGIKPLAFDCLTKGRLKLESINVAYQKLPEIIYQAIRTEFYRNAQFKINSGSFDLDINETQEKIELILSKALENTEKLSLSDKNEQLLIMSQIPGLLDNEEDALKKFIIEQLDENTSPNFTPIR